MDYIILFLFFALCIFTIIRMFKTTSILWLMLGIISAFSIGYYILPVLFKESSGLSRFSSSEITEVLLMSFSFFFFLIIGAILTNKKLFYKNIGLRFNIIDGIFERNYKIIYFIGLIIWLLYFFNNSLTSYAVEDSVAYFTEQSSTAGVIAFLSNFGMAAMAIVIAIMFKNENEKKTIKYLYLFVYLLLTLLLLSTAQRLAVIKPIFMLVAALYMYDNKKLSIKLIIVGVIFLFIVSPLMVFLREFDRKQATNNTFKTLQSYSSKNQNSLDDGFQSILDRADLLKVMIKLKKHFDKSTTNFDLPQYSYSLFASFIPKLIYKDKPYPLSDTGTIWGEISVVAWKINGLSSIGSLSAFGAISAYREGGYIWMFLNGFLVGVLFAWISKLLSNGGVTAKFLLVSLFVTLCVKNIPPSLSYFIIYIAPMLNIIIILYILNKFLISYKK